MAKPKKEKKEKNKFMLGKLFGSTSRVKILKLFILHPQEKYYIRQIARDLALQLNSVRRELENLEAFGILTSKIEAPAINIPEVDTVEGFLINGLEKNNPEQEKEVKKAKEKSEKNNIAKSDKKYYQANTSFVLFNEIKALIIKAQILYERDFIDKLRSTGTVKLLLLTGFFANIDSSPVDILLVGKVNRDKLIMHIRELEGELDREINYTVMDFKEFKYRRDITDVFLYGILESKRIIALDDIGLL